MNNPWSEISPPKEDISGKRVDSTHPLDFFWACDHLGQYLFMYRFESLKCELDTHFPELTGIETSLVKEQGEGHIHRLVLSLKDVDDWELFLALCHDLVQSTKTAENTQKAVPVIVRRLTRWQHFLKNNRRGILSEAEIKGLIGELFFIREHLYPTFGMGNAIQFWQGPEGSPQDFNVKNIAVEVKCQVGTTIPSVRITSTEQLCSQLSEMFLYVVTLGKFSSDSDGVFNLPGLIGEIREKLEGEDSIYIERLNDLLYSVGYIDSDHYLEYNYVMASQNFYRIIEGFPRICPNEIHSGILNLTYSVNLMDCKPYDVGPRWLEYLS
jgi:hypothetical protein